MEKVQQSFSIDQIKEMSVIERLARSRVELQNRPLQKSGYNNYLGYSYFELKDFVPALNEIFLKYRLLPRFSFDDPTSATLTIYGFDKDDEEISFSMVKGEEKGKGSITDVASANTYLKRYLLINSLFLCENDVVDKNFHKENSQEKKEDNKQIESNINKYASEKEKKVASEKIREYIAANKKNTQKIGAIMKGHSFDSLNNMLKAKITSEELATIMMEIKSICAAKVEEKEKASKIQAVEGEMVIGEYMEDDVELGF